MFDMNEEINNSKNINFSRNRALTILLISLAFTVTPYFISKMFYDEHFMSENPFLTELVFPSLSLIFMLLVVVLLKKTRITEALDFIWYRWERSEVVKAALLILAIPIVYMITGVLVRILDLQFKREFKYFANQQGLAFFVTLTVLTAVLFPVIEEIFWRGSIQVVFERIIGKFPALLGQAVLFAAIHFRPLGGFIQVFVLGLLAGFWRWRRRTLLPIIIAHIAINSLWCAVRWPNWLDRTKINVTHNYASEFIELSRPELYDPNDDAREQYSKAVRLVVKIPKELEEVCKCYPSQWSSEEFTMAEAWVSSNTKPLNLIEEGTKKPYYWVEYRRDNIFKNNMPLLLPDILKDMNHIVFALCIRAKLRISQGQFNLALSDIKTCSRLASHFVENKDYLSKLYGWLYYSGLAQTMRTILAHENIDSKFLENLQNQFEIHLEQENFKLDITEERFLVLDAIQCMFTDDSQGDGRIPRNSFRRIQDGKFEFIGNLFPLIDESDIKKWKRLKRHETTAKVERYYKLLNRASSCSPWQYERNFQHVKTNYEQIQKENPFIKMWAFNIRALRIAANSRANLNATVTILGILRYKADNHQYPDSFSELVVKGYIDAIPDDPYSDGQIVYKRTDNSFLLYSLGADFDDDGGTPSKWGEGDIGGDQVFWPVEGTNEYVELQPKVQQ